MTFWRRFTDGVFTLFNLKDASCVYEMYCIYMNTHLLIYISCSFINCQYLFGIEE